MPADKNASIGPLPISGVRMPTWLLRFDKHGACTSPATRQALLDRLAHGTPPTDLIFFSHGWNNDFDDAIKLYGEFLHNFETLADAHPAGRPFDPLFVGVLWPSIWLTLDNGPVIAGAGGASAAAADDAVTAALAERLVAAGHGASLERVYALLAEPALDAAETRELAQLLAPAFGAAVDDEAAAGARATSADDLHTMLRAMQQAQDTAAAPAADTRPLDDWSDAGGTDSAAAIPGVQAAGFFSALDPRNALRLFSVYQMKDRAGVVGFNGVAALLRAVLGATAAPVHVAGHSYGCKVMLSAICAPAALARPVASLLLLQPAISHLCFAGEVPGAARPGGYVAALSPERVRAPIYSTYSGRDFALHNTFHLALRRDGDLGEQNIGMAGGAGAGDTTAGSPPSRFAALGGYGPRLAGQKLVDPMPAAGMPYPAAPAGTPIVAFDGSQGLILGHGDVSDETAAWALNRLVFR